MRGVTREQIVAAAKVVAGKVKGALRLRDLERHAGISLSQVYYHYPEGWLAVLRAAGLSGRESRRGAVSKRELMDNYHSVVQRVGRLPTWAELRLFGRISNAVYVNRFGQMDAVRAVYRRWCAAEGVKGVREEWELEADRRAGRAAGRASPGVAHGGVERGGTVSGGRKGLTQSRQTLGTVGNLGTDRAVGTCGRPFVFRGIANEPVNEMGVVHLFGMVCRELGYVVVRMGSRFPDCTALRETQGKAGQWETVRVEFEFRSSAFKLHRHDAAGCDVIVCWENDWKGCPLEVVELRSVVRALRAA